MKKIILLILVLAAGIALGIYFQKQTKAQKLETQVQTDVGQVETDAKAGVQKADAVAGAVKVDAQKVAAVVTNAVDKLK